MRAGERYAILEAEDKAKNERGRGRLQAVVGFGI